MARRRDIVGIFDATGSTFKVTTVTVTAVATALPTTVLDNRKAISIFNESSADWVRLGNSDVAFSGATKGYPLLPHQGLPFDMSSGAKLFAIADTGKNVEISVLEVDNG